MAYDASEVTRALERPTLTVERPWWQILLGVHHLFGRTKTYRGRILSHPEFSPLYRRWVEQQTGGPPPEEGLDPEEVSLKLIRDTCKAIGIPYRVVKRLPGQALGGAMRDFLTCQLRASGLEELAEEVRKTKTPRRSRPASGSPNGTKTRRTATR